MSSPADFAHYTDAEWWNFGIGLATAVGTVGAVAVAVVDSIRANTRAAKADRRAADAEAAQNAIQQNILQNTAADQVKLAQLDANIATNQAWLKVAEDYKDELRARDIRARLMTLRSEYREEAGTSHPSNSQRTAADPNSDLRPNHDSDRADGR
jgi:hypothetical protein